MNEQTDISEKEDVLDTIVDGITEEAHEEQIEQEKSPEKGMAAIKWLFENTLPNPTAATKTHNPSRKRGVGVTRKNKEQSKAGRRASKKSRKINRGKK